MYKLIMGIGVVLAVGLAGLGCGGSGETASASLDKHQFVKQANAICVKAKKKREAAIADWEKTQPEENVDVDEGLQKVVAPSLKKEAEQLEALVPPAENEAAIDKLVALLSTGSEVIEEAGEKGFSRSGLDVFEQKAAARGLNACSGL